MPPYRWTSASETSKNRLSSSCIASAPIRSARPVESTMSQKNTVTCLRSPSTTGRAGAGAARSGSGARPAPQVAQNGLPGVTAAPHAGQRPSRAAPHSSQNRAPGRGAA